MCYFQSGMIHKPLAFQVPSKEPKSSSDQGHLSEAVASSQELGDGDLRTSAGLLGVARRQVGPGQYTFT